ncbi:DUF177 domain-containing protein [uncultured Litoreibacter sp.]|uniref:YceD family protein n=1 Tax=uncultured Litoreibacter sp. TaxID=1392394 RepID=UPI0026221C8C|nr:DUF177 domain-containing protein [uncultured Litoreibacter sp.]
MSDTNPLFFRTADLPQKRITPLEFAADAAQRAAMAADLGVAQIKKLAFKGTLRAAGKTDWTLTGHLGATVVQPCVITLDPVTTRVEENVTRHYISDWQDPEDAEVEMPGDDTSEPLGAEIDVMATITEALSLAIPAYPRANGAELGAMVHAEPGIEPLNEETVKPFASLADLKKKMENKG